MTAHLDATRAGEGASLDELLATADAELVCADFAILRTACELAEHVLTEQPSSPGWEGRCAQTLSRVRYALASTVNRSESEHGEGRT